MKHTRTSSHCRGASLRRHCRSAFTLVELLVVITIISILMGLLIPAVNSAREVARRNQCGTQQKNLALAAFQHEGAKGELPGYIQRFGLFAGGVADPSDPGNYSGSVPRHVKVGTWAVALLPWLDAQPTYEHWTEDRYPIIADGNGDLGNTGGEAGDDFHPLAAPNLAIFQCPSNPVSVGNNAKNSYISNNGMCHLDVDDTSPYAADNTADFISGVSFVDSQARANGAFNCKYNVTGTGLDRTSEGDPVRMSDFKDGQGNTILFSENVQALPWNRAGFIDGSDVETAMAADTEVLFSAGVESREGARYVHGMVWHYEDPEYASTALATLWNDNGTGTNVVPDAVVPFHRINGGDTSVSDDIFTKTMDNTDEGRNLARPSSAHVDGVNCGMADGATRFITESVDYRVYQALMTPRGKSSNVPWPEFVLTDEAF
tara:strand:- start:3379 stop:4674 length:1296 start_codon:yes stop_codon:yes gene_type:complete